MRVLVESYYMVTQGEGLVDDNFASIVAAVDEGSRVVAFSDPARTPRASPD